jgi:hypothetical protein
VVWLWSVALFALPFHHLSPRGFGAALQPAEIAALPLVVYGALLWARGRRVRSSVVDVGVVAWFIGVLIAVVAFFVRVRGVDTVVLRELLVSIYLVALYFAIRVSASEPALRRFPALFVASATIAAALGILGFGLAVAGVDTSLAFPAGTPYPYLGTTARAQALTSTPGMLASILMFALLLVAGAWKARPWVRLTAASVVALGLLLTFSKTILCLLAGLIAVAYVMRRRHDPARRGLPLAGVAVAPLLLAATYFALSHFVILRESANRTNLERGMFVSEEPLARISFGSGRYVVLRTNYFFNKRTSLIAVRQTWPIGVGPGRQPAFAGALRRDGLYPVNLWLGAPHSTYLGAAAEGGLPGVLGLAAFLGALTVGVLRLTARDDLVSGFSAAAAGALVALLIEGLSTDVMHFRHYWWLAAVVAAWSVRETSWRESMGHMRCAAGVLRAAAARGR